MSLIVFSHANSFPAATYAVMFKNLRSRGYLVRAVDKFGHDPKYPVTDNWRHLVQQLHDFAEREVEKHGEPAFLVGHSLGGFLSLMCAARYPKLARGVLLLDSPLLGGWKATALGAMKRTQLVGSISPGRVSVRRKNRWPTSAAGSCSSCQRSASAPGRDGVPSGMTPLASTRPLICGEVTVCCSSCSVPKSALRRARNGCSDNV